MLASVTQQRLGEDREKLALADAGGDRPLEVPEHLHDDLAVPVEESELLGRLDLAGGGRHRRRVDENDPFPLEREEAGRAETVDGEARTRDAEVAQRRDDLAGERCRTGIRVVVELPRVHRPDVHEGLEAAEEMHGIRIVEEDGPTLGREPGRSGRTSCCSRSAWPMRRRHSGRSGR